MNLGQPTTSADPHPRGRSPGGTLPEVVFRTPAAAPLRALLLGLPLLLAAACGGEPASDWNGIVTDSAGIRVVTNPASPLWSPEEGWWVEEELRIGGDESVPEILFGYLADVAVDRNGNILALDQQARAVRVFDARGDLVRTLGGPGEGPGELGTFPASVLVRGDTVLVADGTANRLVRYGIDGAVLEPRPLPGPPGSRRWGEVGPGGDLWFRILAPTTDGEGPGDGVDLLLRVPGRGGEGPGGGEGGATGAPGTARPMAAAVGPVDTVMVFRYSPTELGRPGDAVVPPVVNVPLWTVLPGGRVAWTTLEASEIRVVEPGERAPAFVVRGRSWQARTPSDTDLRALRILVEERLEMLGGDARTLDVLPLVEPERLPVFTDLRAGPDGTLWVQRLGDLRQVHPMAVNTPDPPRGWGGAVWDVLDREGRYLGSVEMPPRFRVMAITPDRVVGVQADPRNMDRILVLTLHRPGAGG